MSETFKAHLRKFCIDRISGYTLILNELIPKALEKEITDMIGVAPAAIAKLA